MVTAPIAQVFEIDDERTWPTTTANHSVAFESSQVCVNCRRGSEAGLVADFPDAWRPAFLRGEFAHRPEHSLSAHFSTSPSFFARSRA